MVAAVERAEKRDLERAGVAVTNEQRLALGLAPFGLGGVIAAIEHTHAAVAIDTVAGTHVGHAALKAVIKAGDFVPLTHVAFQLKGADRGHTGGRAERAGGEQERGGDQDGDAPETLPYLLS